MRHVKLFVKVAVFAFVLTAVVWLLLPTVSWIGTVGVYLRFSVCDEHGRAIPAAAIQVRHTAADKKRGKTVKTVITNASGMATLVVGTPRGGQRKGSFDLNQNPLQLRHLHALVDATGYQRVDVNLSDINLHPYKNSAGWVGQVEVIMIPQ